MNKNIIIYDNVTIGKDATIEDFVIIGKPPRGTKPGQLQVTIGDYPILRSGTIIYAGNVIGKHFQTGDNARIRENNKIRDSVSIGTNTVVECGCEIREKARIHSNCFICEYTQIEENAWIGPGVITTNVLHPPCPIFKKNAPILEEKCCNGPIIKRNAIIGAGAIILPGIVIGKEAVVGSGSVVTKDIPTGYVVAGIPAKIIKRVEELTCLLGFYKKGEIYSWRKR